MQKFLVGCSSAALILGLSACGEGPHPQPAPPPPLSEPGPPPVPPPSTPPTAENFVTPEYNLSTSAKNSNVLPAWQAGATGKGIKIGIVDSGITTGAAEFAGRIDPASRGFGTSLEDSYGHGTAVASIAAAAHDGALLEGLAFDSTLVVMNVAAHGCSSGGCDFDTSDIASGIRAAAAAGARVINLSIGGSNSSTVNDAVRDAASRGVIFVVAAGNDRASSPTDFARGILAAAGGQAIVVGGLGVDVGAIPTAQVDYNQMWSDSNRAGSARDWYLGAPGYAIEVAYQHGYDQVRGTSFAAPAVAGAVALMMQAFPNLSADDVVQILLATADDLGVSGVDSTFGHGRLDVGRAFQPLGATAMAGTGKAVATDWNGSAPAAVGDAVVKGSLNAVILDAYRRAFTINLARTLAAAPAAQPMYAAMAGGLSGGASAIGPMRVDVGLRDPGFGAHALWGKDVGSGAGDKSLANLSLSGALGHGTSAAVGFSTESRSLLEALSGWSPRSFAITGQVLATPGVAPGGTAFAARQSLGPVAIGVGRQTGTILKAYVGESDAAFALSTVTVDGHRGPVRMLLSASTLDERQTVLGGRLAGAFGDPGASTRFVDVRMTAAIASGWQVSASGRHGWTRFGAGAMQSDAYALGVERTGLLKPGDRLSLTLSQPLRVTRGGFAMLLPATYDYETLSADVERSRMSLAPAGREVAAELGYSRYWNFGDAGLNLFVRRQPGHFADSAPDVGGALRLKLRL